MQQSSFSFGQLRGKGESLRQLLGTHERKTGGEQSTDSKTVRRAGGNRTGEDPSEEESFLGAQLASPGHLKAEASPLDGGGIAGEIHRLKRIQTALVFRHRQSHPSWSSEC